MDVLFRSHEDAGALLSGLLVDKYAVNFGIDAVVTGVLPITADLQTTGEDWGGLQPLFGPLMGEWTLLVTLRTRQLSHYRIWTVSWLRTRRIRKILTAARR